MSKNVKKMCQNIQTFLKSVQGILIPSCGKRESLSIHDESRQFFPCIDFNSSLMTVSSFLEENLQKVIFGGNWNIIEYTWCLGGKNTNNHDFEVKNIPKYSCTCICFFYVIFSVKHDCHVTF